MNLSEEQHLFQTTVRRFAAERLAPTAELWESRGTLDRDALVELGAMGLGAICAKEEFGGSGLGRFDAALIFEELSRGDVSHAAFLSIHNMATWMIDKFGSEALRAQFVPRLATLDLIASYCLTEPDAGSDAGNLRTSARLEGDEYEINGSKAFISGAGFSDVYVVMVRTSDAGAKGISAILVPKDAPGLSFGKMEEKMGWRAQPTGAVIFDNCRVPAGNLIGELGAGFTYAMMGLDSGRLNIGACSIGGAQEALDRGIDYVKERRQFGVRIADFQGTQFKIADLQTELDAARALLRNAALSLDEGRPSRTRDCAMAKLFATDAGFRVANASLQLFGGYGYLTDFGIERIVRDLRVHQILEGTNEIMRHIISRDILH